jgi:hypothetical protein
VWLNTKAAAAAAWWSERLCCGRLSLTATAAAAVRSEVDVAVVDDSRCCNSGDKGKSTAVQDNTRAHLHIYSCAPCEAGRHLIVHKQTQHDVAHSGGTRLSVELRNPDT